MMLPKASEPVLMILLAVMFPVSVAIAPSPSIAQSGSIQQLMQQGDEALKSAGRHPGGRQEGHDFARTQPALSLTLVDSTAQQMLLPRGSNCSQKSST